MKGSNALKAVAELCFGRVVVMLLVTLFPLYEALGVEASSPLSVPDKGEAFESLLSASEKQWLSSHPVITIAINNAWPPMDYVDEKGLPNGLGVSFIELLNNQLGGVLKIVPGSWKDIYRQVKTGELDALMDITPRKSRQQYFNFTSPYIKVPHVIVADNNRPYIASIADLAGHTIAIEKGFYLKTVVEEQYPDIGVAEYPNTSDALDSVIKGKTYAYIGNRAVAAYIMQHELMTSLEFHGKVYESSSTNAIGVRKDLPILRDILQKALDNIKLRQRVGILQQWVNTDNLIAEKDVSLTEKEWTWLEDRPVIRVAGDPAFAPIEYRGMDGYIKGIATEYLDAISAVLGVRFEYDNSATWEEAVDKLQRRELDMFAAAASTPSRQVYANFTQPYLKVPIMVFSLEDGDYISALHELAGKTVAAVKGYAATEMLKRDKWDFSLTEFDTVTQALQAVQKGEVDAYIGNILTGSYYIRKGSYANIKVSGHTPYRLDLGMGVRNDWSALAGILNKVLEKIGETDKDKISARWIGLKVSEQPDYSLFWYLFLAITCILLAVMFWGMYLRKRNLLQSRKIKEQKRLLNVSPVTGHFNRANILEHIRQHIGDKLPFSLLFVDLLNIKRINETMGFAAGDELIRYTGERLDEVVDTHGVVSHLGGGQFLLFTVHPDRDAVKDLIERILERFTAPFDINNDRIHQRACIGIAQYPDDGVDAELLLSRAHLAANQARQDGQHNFTFFSTEYNQLVQRQFQVETLIDDAVDNNELTICYQPIMDARRGGLIGVEALLRWCSPVLGEVPPSEFIPLAEHSECIVSIGRWVIDESIRQLSALQDIKDSNFTLSINLSPRQFLDKTLVAHVEECLQRHRFPGNRLVFELTESLLLEKTERVYEQTVKLRELDAALALDDFGTGFSSLDYLRRYSFNTLKIDRSFIQDYPQSMENAGLIKAIIAMGEALDLKVIAEGVETPAQLQFLLDEGCSYFQGYYFSKPMTSSALKDWLNKQAI